MQGKTRVSGIRSPAVIVAMLMCAAGFSGCPKNDPEKGTAKKAADTAIVKVVVADVKEAPFEDWGSYSADLRGIEDANLVAPYQGGRVNSLKPVGTRFKTGDALCDIDGDKYGTALEAAKAQVEVAKGDLDRARVNVEKGALGRSALDGANLAYQNARMVLATAKRAWEDCRCEAPFDGVLVSRTMEKYQTVAPGSPTVRISRVDRLQAVVAIPETEAFSYTEGMAAEFHLLQRPETAYQGTLMSLDRAVDSHTRTVAARIIIFNRDGSLKPGMVGRTRILRKKYQKAIIVPSTALVRIEQGITVMVAENGIARQHFVEVSATSGDSSLVTKGLVPGDKLIVTGAFQVSDGTRVTF